MFCPSCGVALSTKMKFCNRCGSQLTTTDQIELVKIFEKRMDSEMEGLFWISILGIAAIFGGAALLKKLQLSEWIIVSLMIFGAVVFITYFGLGVWQVRRLAQRGKEVSIAEIDQEVAGTDELNPARPLPALDSVTENTTRTLDPISTDWSSTRN